MLATVDRMRVTWRRLGGWHSHRVPTGQGRLHVLEARGWGTLPQVLLLHGLGASAVDWGPLLRWLRGSCRRVWAVDLPGHGHSEVPRDGMRAAPVREMLLEGLDAVLGGPVVVLGNSLGGVVAAKLALERPSRVRGLILVSPAGGPLSDTGLQAFVEGLRLDDHQRALLFVDRVHARRPLARHLLAWGTRRRFAAPPIRQLLDNIGVEDLLTPDELASLRMPVLLLWGRQERILPREHLAFWREHLPPHAQVWEPDGMGHAPFLDRPRAFAHRVLRFVAGTATAC